VLTRRWRHWLGVTVAGAITADALATFMQVQLYDAPRAGDLVDWLVVAVALAGPALAALVLWGAVGHRARLAT
jgi:hypothetical protein